MNTFLSGKQKVLNKKELVLLTGVPRAGTSVVGDVLAKHSSIDSVFEPFNFHLGWKSVENYFPISDLDFTNEFCKKFLDNEIKFKSGILPEDGFFKKLRKRLGFSGTKLSYNRAINSKTVETIIIKDPTACFLSPDFISKDYKVIYLYRNPFSVAASFKRMKWGFDMEDIIKRMKCSALENIVDDVSTEIELLKDESLYLKSALLLWLLSYSLAYSKKNEVLIVDHGDILRDPISTYQKMLNYMGYDLTNDHLNIIKEFKSAKNSGPPKEGVAHQWNRSMDTINEYWKEILSEKEIKVVESICNPLISKLEGLKC